MDNYYGNQYFANSEAFEGNQSSQNAYGVDQRNPNAYGFSQSNPNTYGTGQGNPNSYGTGQSNPNAYSGGSDNSNAYSAGPGNSNAYSAGPGNSNAYGGSQGNPNANGGGQVNPNAYGGSQGTPSAYGGGQGYSNAYGGEQSNSNAYSEGQGSQNSYGGGQVNSNASGRGQGNFNTSGRGQGNPNAYGRGQGNPNAYGGGQGNPNAYGGGQGNPSAYGANQGNPSTYGGGQTNPNAYGGGGGQGNFDTYGDQANPGAYAGCQTHSDGYGGGQGDPSAYGGHQGNSPAFGRDIQNSDTYGGFQGNSNSYGADQSIVEQATNPQGDQIYASRNENDSRKIFVGGLSWDITTEDLYEYFQQFGEVSDANLKMNPATNQSRGFGFVLFKDESGVERTVAHEEHILKGRTIDPKRAMAEGSKELNSKIFIGGIDPRLGKAEIVEVFSKFGTVKQIELPYDRVKNERRGFGFITFDSEDMAELVCRNGKVALGKRKVDVRRLNTKDNRPPPDAMGRPRVPSHVPSASPPKRFPHQGRGRGGRGGGFVDPNVYQNNGMYRSGCPEEDDDEFSTLQTAYDAIAAVASTINLPIWGGDGGYGGFNQPPFRGRGGYDRSRRGGSSSRGGPSGRGGGGPARGRGGSGSQAGPGFHPYNR